MPSDSSSRRRVLVVDDSPFIRRVVCDVIQESPDFAVAGEAGDGLEALGQVHALSPDLVTLDVHMPRLDGLATLGYLMSEAPRPVVMLSALDDGGDTTMRALELGAVDFVRKPAVGDALDLSTLRDRLLGALRAAAGARYQSVPALVRPRVTSGGGARSGGQIGAHSGARSTALGSAAEGGTATGEPATHLVVIAASTGGPRALAEVVPALLPTSAAVIIAQHMPPGFTESLARRLDTRSALPVQEARDGDPVEGGRVYVAPGGLHTRVDADRRGLRLAVHAGAPLHGVAPAADLLFSSAASAMGARCVAVVLTGMGQDGAEGARAVRRGGGLVVVQDAATAIVFGMPQATLQLAGADAVVSLEGIATAIAQALRQRGLRAGG